jgi:heme oxygenase
VSREPNGSNSESQMATTQLSNFLAHVLPPGLERSKRLRNDLAILFGLNAVDLDVLLARFPGSKVHEYAAHIRQVVADKPHVLVAYAWVMYMAIFSGGRWMRQQLCSAGQEFWTAKGVGSSPGEAATRNDNLSVHNPGLSFFDFEGDLDGEDIKAAFKLRLQDAEGLLTSSQRQDIIEEAKEIFRYSIALVEELDDLLRTPCDTDVNLVDGVQSSTKGHPVRPKLTFTWTRPNEAWLYAQGITGFAFVVSCISWYAYYHATS